MYGVSESIEINSSKLQFEASLQFVIFYHLFDVVV